MKSPSEVFRENVLPLKTGGADDGLEDEDKPNKTGGTDEPKDGEDKSVNNDKKPVHDDKKPIDDDDKTVDDDKKPMNDDKKPVNGDDKPVDDDENLVNDDKKPVDDDTKPVNDDDKPVDDDMKPIDDDDELVDDDKKPVDGDEKPNNETKDDGDKPDKPDNKPVPEIITKVEIAVEFKVQLADISNRDEEERENLKKMLAAGLESSLQKANPFGDQGKVIVTIEFVLVKDRRRDADQKYEAVVTVTYVAPEGISASDIPDKAQLGDVASGVSSAASTTLTSDEFKSTIDQYSVSKIADSIKVAPPKVEKIPDPAYPTDVDPCSVEATILTCEPDSIQLDVPLCEGKTAEGFAHGEFFIGGDSKDPTCAG